MLFNGDVCYEIQEGDDTHTIDLNKNTCTCSVGFMCIKANISLRITIYIYCQLIRNLKGHTQKE